MKTYKGLDLVKAVANYEIEKGTKLKCIHYPTYGQGIEVDEYQEILIWSDTKEPVSYVHFNDNSFEFEIIEEEKEIEEIKMIGCNMEINLFDKKTLLPTENMQTEFIISKINELVREVRKLKEK